MKLTYVDGYVAGQHDALTWITVPCQDDAPLAAFDFRVQMRAALVCLAHNLSIAAGLCAAFDLGWDRCHALEFGDRNGRLATWKPGCGKATP